MRLGFVTDTHFSVTRTGFRTDDFFHSVLEKLRQCYSHFTEEGCEAVIHGGDFFDRHHSYSYQMLTEVRDTLLSTGLRTYYVWGQHDLLGYNRETSSGSNLAFLTRILDGTLVEINGSVTLHGQDGGEKVVVHAVHVDMDPVKSLQAVPKDDGAISIAVVHALLDKSGSPSGTIPVGRVGEVNADIVLSGDLHTGFPQTRIGHTLFYNPGSLARTSREDRKPKCCVIDTESLAIEDFYPVSNENPFPEREAVKQTVDSKDDTGRLAKEFLGFKGRPRDIVECLENAARESGASVNGDVMAYIKEMASKAADGTRA